MIWNVFNRYEPTKPLPGYIFVILLLDRRREGVRTATMPAGLCFARPQIRLADNLGLSTGTLTKPVAFVFPYRTNIISSFI